MIGRGSAFKVILAGAGFGLVVAGGISVWVAWARSEKASPEGSN
jgi:hypothetical protein